MDFLTQELNDYATLHSNVFQSDILAEIERHTHLKEMMPQMLSGYLQGQFLALISKLVQPKRILEIGTFTGYSAVCLAQGLTTDGKMITLEVNEELEKPVNAFFKKAGLGDKIEMRIGNAVEMINELEDSFDLVFIDADKVNYPNYYELILPKMRIGGLILVDNVLWSGKVTQEPIKDKKTAAIHALNQRIQNDERVENMLLPLRDGMMMARRAF